MVDWRQIHISLDIELCRNFVGGDGKESMELDVEIGLKGRGYDYPTEPGN